jgi:thioredoxin reductase (NADPH)
MLRPSQKNGNGRKSPPPQQQQPLLPVTNAGTTYRRRKRLYGDNESTIVHQMQAITLVFVSVILVFYVAIRSTTHNLNRQQQATFRQEENVVDISNHQHQEQQHRFMTKEETAAAATIADVTAYDLVIVGAGPAGLTASLFGARAGLSVLVLGATASSQLYQATILDNFPSYFYSASAAAAAGTSSSIKVHQDWLQTTQRQAAAAGVHFALAGLTVNRIHLPPPSKKNRHLLGAGAGGGLFGVELSRHESSSSSRNVVIPARSVIIATGAVEERLHLAGEDKLWAKSVHSCAICDGSLYVNQAVVVVGGGDAAVEAAMLLSRYARHVLLVHRRFEYRASDQANVQALQNLKNVQVLTPFVVQGYDVSKSNNGEQLTGVVLQHVETKTNYTINCNGVFVMIGSKPNTDFIKDNTTAAPMLKLDPEGYIVVSHGGDHAAATAPLSTTTVTSVPGIFAAGQVVDKTYRQAITAAASGAQAAIDADRWLRLQQSYSSGVSSVAVQAARRRHLPVVPLQTIEVKDNHMPQQRQQLPEARTDKQKESLQDCDLTREDCIRELVSKYVCVVFSKPYCPYCKKALAALELEGIKADGGYDELRVIDLTSPGIDGAAIQATLQKMTGRRTVPNVFVGGKSIGGGDETSQLRASGQLRKLLDAAAKAMLLQNEIIVVDSKFNNPGDDCDLTTESCITAVVNKSPVVVFSKPYCPFCKKALAALEVEGVSTAPFLHVIDLTERNDNGSAVQATLYKMTGRRTVPNVFVGGKSIGGGDETSQLHRDGKLKSLLEAAMGFAVTS